MISNNIIIKTSWLTSRAVTVYQEKYDQFKGKPKQSFICLQLNYLIHDPDVKQYGDVLEQFFQRNKYRKRHTTNPGKVNKVHYENNIISNFLLKNRFGIVEG